MSDFLRFPEQRIISNSDSNHVIATSHKDSAEACQAWAEVDPECQIYQYDDQAKLCSKLQTIHNYDSVLGVRLKGNCCPYGKLTQRAFLNYSASDFRFDPSIHRILSQTRQPSLEQCQRQAAAKDSSQFILYNVESQQCTAFAGSTATHSQMGVKILGRLNEVCGDTLIGKSLEQTKQAGQMKSIAKSPLHPKLMKAPKPKRENEDNFPNHDTKNASASVYGGNVVSAGNAVHQPVSFAPQLESGPGIGYTNPAPYLEDFDNGDGQQQPSSPASQSSPSLWDRIKSQIWGASENTTTYASKTSIYLILFLCIILAAWIYWTYTHTIKRKHTAVTKKQTESTTEKQLPSHGLQEPHESQEPPPWTTQVDSPHATTHVNPSTYFPMYSNPFIMNST